MLLALPLALALKQPARPISVNYLAVNVAIYGIFVVLSGGDWMPLQRFMVHVLPFVSLLVHAGFARLAQILQAHQAAWVALLLILGQAGYMLTISLEERFILGTGSGPSMPNGSTPVAYLRRHVCPSDTIAVAEAGLIAYQLPLETRIVDMVGLTDAHIAHRPMQLPGGLFGRGDGFGKWDVDYVLDQKPRFVQVNILGKAPDGTWLTNFTGTTLLVNDPRFQKMYEVVTEPEVVGIFARRDEECLARFTGPDNGAENTFTNWLASRRWNKANSPTAVGLR